MQVETENDVGSSPGDNLPYSTLALRALQSCVESRDEPLATHSLELLGAFRGRVNGAMRRSFASLDAREFALRMNLDPDGSDGEPWREYGWVRMGEGGDRDYIVPDHDDFEEEEDVLAQRDIAASEGDRVRKLTDVVMFFEDKMNT